LFVGAVVKGFLQHSKYVINSS